MPVGELGQQGPGGRTGVLRGRRGDPPLGEVPAQRRDVQLVALLGRDRGRDDRDAEIVADQVEQRVHVVDFELDAVRQAGRGESPVGQHPCSPVGLESDEREPVQRGQADLVGGGQLVVRVAEHDQRLSRQRHHHHAARRRAGHRNQGHIQAAGRQQVGQPGRSAEPEPDLDPGMPGPEPGQLGRDVHDAEALFAADAQGPSQHPAHRGHRVMGGGHAGQRAVRLGEQHPARLGELDPAGAAHEQWRAQLGLQRPDRRRQAGLGDLQQLRSPGEVGLLGDRHEVFQLAQLHD